MTEEQRPVGATIVMVIMGAASILWLILGVVYFFGFIWWWAAGYPWAWLLGILYGLLGLIGLGIAGALAMGLRQAYTATLILSIIFVAFSIPSFYYLDWYGIISGIIWGIVLILLLIPSTKAFFKQETPQTTI